MEHEASVLPPLHSLKRPAGHWVQVAEPFAP